MSNEDDILKQIEPKNEARSSAPKAFIILVLVFTLVSFTYRFLLKSDYSQTSALYVGIPALLAIGLSFIPTPRSITGRILLSITLAMLAVGILAIEGLICILIALPFFLAIGFIVGIFIDKARARKNLAKTRLSLVVVLGALSLEGTSPNLSRNRHEKVTINRTVNLSEAQLKERLATGPRFEARNLPTFLRAGFPSPLASTGGGDLKQGTQWIIPFDHGDHVPRSLTVEISEVDSNSLTLIPIKDETEMSKWMTWDKVSWNWTAVDKDQVKVTVSFEFSRNLDPAFYFSPVQRFGVWQAGSYFLDSIVGP